MRVAVDTNILIWGVRQVASAGQAGQVGKALALFEWLAERGDQIALPAPTVAEFLVGERAENHVKVQRALSTSYPILPFDARAVALAARLRQDKGFLAQLRDDFGKDRVPIRRTLKSSPPRKRAALNDCTRTMRG